MSKSPACLFGPPSLVIYTVSSFRSCLAKDITQDLKGKLRGVTKCLAPICNIIVLVAKLKLRLHHEHETGGGPLPPDYNEMDLAVLHILGNSPSFIGIVDRDTDTGIEMPLKKRKSNLEVKRCNASVVAETAGTTKALNTGNLTLGQCEG